jgi:nucleoside-diphosphate-sugar epimerase
MGHAVALGSGLVGRFVIERLLEAGHEVTIVDLHVPDAFPRKSTRECEAR